MILLHQLDRAEILDVAVLIHRTISVMKEVTSLTVPIVTALLWHEEARY